MITTRTLKIKSVLTHPGSKTLAISSKKTMCGVVKKVMKSQSGEFRPLPAEFRPFPADFRPEFFTQISSRYEKFVLLNYSHSWKLWKLDCSG